MTFGVRRVPPDAEFKTITLLNFPWTSPTLGIRFEMFADGLKLFFPNGEPFKDPETLFEERDQAQQERDRAFAKLRELGIDPSTL